METEDHREEEDQGLSEKPLSVAIPWHFLLSKVTQIGGTSQCYGVKNQELRQMLQSKCLFMAGAKFQSPMVGK